MATPAFHFNDGAAYDRMMGVWSRSVGEIFLDWLAPRPGLSWVDVGCGSGAFSQLLADRCAPAAIQGIDPSEAQLAFALQRPVARLAEFRQGDAMALPYPNGAFDAAAMALVLAFVPEPAKGVAEMVRVVKPGGTVAAYMWDMPGGGAPFQPLFQALQAMGHTVPRPPSAAAAGLEPMRALWTEAGLEAVEGRVIEVQRSFPDFEDFWSMTTTGSGSLSEVFAALSPTDADALKVRVRARLLPDAEGRIAYSARANAIKGRKPGPR